LGNDPAFAARYAEYRKMESPTVLDFLSTLEDGAGVSYSHAWWDSYPLLSRVGGSVLLIGLIWPTMVNLLVFGRLSRPPEDKGIDLSGVETCSTQPMPRPGLSEAELAAAGSDAAPPADHASVAAPAVVALSTQPVEAAAASPEEDKHFTAKPDDFYPTDHHVHPSGPRASGGSLRH
jgi:hypothetical protein